MLGCFAAFVILYCVSATAGGAVWVHFGMLKTSCGIHVVSRMSSCACRTIGQYREQMHKWLADFCVKIGPEMQGKPWADIKGTCQTLFWQVIVDLPYLSHVLALLHHAVLLSCCADDPQMQDLIWDFIAQNIYFKHCAWHHKMASKHWTEEFSRSNNLTVTGRPSPPKLTWAGGGGGGCGVQAFDVFCMRHVVIYGGLICQRCQKCCTARHGVHAICVRCSLLTPQFTAAICPHCSQ